MNPWCKSQLLSNVKNKTKKVILLLTLHDKTQGHHMNVHAAPPSWCNFVISLSLIHPLLNYFCSKSSFELITDLAKDYGVIYVHPPTLAIGLRVKI